MTKPGDSPTTKKTIHKLAKEFPEKTYRELEKYRNADRQEEEKSIPLTESQKSQKDLEPIGKGVCITAALKKDRSYPDLTEVLAAENNKLKKRAQEAEGELSILKGIETNRVKEAQARCNHLQNELDRVKKENNDLFNRVADALQVDESHQKLNGKLQERLTELEEENKKMHDAFNKQIDGARKAGL